MFNNSTKHIKKKFQVFHNQRGKLIGKLENGVLSKVVKGSIHQLRKPPSWAWDKSVIEEAEKLGGEKTQIIDSETNTKFISTFADFRKFGISINRGFGEQIALPIAYWLTDDQNNLQLKLF